MWAKVIATAPEGKVTAAHVSKIVKEMTKVNPDPPPPQRDPREISDAMLFAGIAISQLKRIDAKDPEREQALKKVANWINEHRNGDE